MASPSLTRRTLLEGALAVPMALPLAAPLLGVASEVAAYPALAVVPALDVEGASPRANIIPEVSALSVASEQSSAWNKALACYQAARSTHEEFIEHILVPAEREFQRFRQTSDEEVARAAFPRIVALEGQGDDLNDLKIEALAALVGLPAPDLPSLLTKLQLLWHDYYSHDDPNGYFAAILADSERLTGQGLSNSCGTTLSTPASFSIVSRETE